MASLRQNKEEQQQLTPTTQEAYYGEYSNMAMLIHNEDLVSRLASSEMRLPPNYVGVRQVRPTMVSASTTGTSNTDNATTTSRQNITQEQQQPQESRKNQTTTTKYGNDSSDGPVPNNNNNKRDFVASPPPPSSAVTFKVLGDDGQERRMTKQEKKECKRQRALQEKEAKKKFKIERRQMQLQQQQQQQMQLQDDQGLQPTLKRKRQDDDDNTDVLSHRSSLEGMLQSDLLNDGDIAPPTAVALSTSHSSLTSPSNSEPHENNVKSNNNNYHELKVDPNQLEEERADLNVDRHSILPVIMSPPMAWLAMTKMQKNQNLHCDNDQHGLEPTPTASQSSRINQTRASEESNQRRRMTDHDATDTGNNINEPKQQPDHMAYIQYHEELSLEWAQLLKKSMLEAETVREAEDMRPMAYQLVPEPWTRHRTGSSNNNNNDNPGGSGSDSSHDSNSLREQQKRQRIPLPTAQRREFSPGIRSYDKLFQPSSCDWSFVSIRPPSSQTSLDSDLSIVLEYLHRATPFFISCGAKFGCDFLLYDGPRHERHAFAGLRILTPTNTGSSSHRNNRHRRKGNGSNSQSEQGSSSSQLSSSISNAPPSVTCHQEQTKWNFVLPTAYSMSGYVRGLNTAGKLALIAMVIRDGDDVQHYHADDASNHHSRRTIDSSADNFQPHDDPTTLRDGVEVYRVVIVDLALEKVLSAPTHQRRRNHGNGTMARRREVGQHLAKTNTITRKSK